MIGAVRPLCPRCAKTPPMFPCWHACNLSSSLLLHCLHVSSPKGPLTPCHTSSPSNCHQGTVFTRASKADHFLEKLFKYLTRCVNSPNTFNEVIMQDPRNVDDMLLAPGPMPVQTISVQQAWMTGIGGMVHTMRGYYPPRGRCI